MSEAFVHYQKLLDDIEILTKTLHNRFTKQITCHLGCTACCYQQLTLSQVEVGFISVAIKKLPLEKQKKIKLAAQAILENTAQTDACAMLDGLGCSIYEFRPVICRTHGFPISFQDEETKESVLDVCPLNFADEENLELNLTDTIDIDRLNLRLAAINYAYCRDEQGEVKKSAERMAMAEIIISALSNLPL